MRRGRTPAIVWARPHSPPNVLFFKVRDEFGYVVGSSDMDKPLTNFSNKCNLNLDFTHPQFIGKV